MKTKKSFSSVYKDQSGIASMVIVMLIMAILTLIVLSMTKNSNREQREALDRQLSSQAFYAAESGINDAKDFVVDPPDAVNPANKKTDCGGVNDAAEGDQFPEKSSQVGEFENTKYTCVLYDRTPNELAFDSVDTMNSKILPIEDYLGRNIISLTIRWTQEDGGTNFSACPGNDLRLPRRIPVTPPSSPSEPDCQAGMLRVELVDPFAPSRDVLIDSSFLAYVKPSSNSSVSGTLPFGSGVGLSKQGYIKNVFCTSANSGCQVTIDGINKDKLYLNLRSIYKSNEVFITGRVTGTDPVMRFRGAQMEVDSTGQASDILRRVKAMVDLTGIDSNFIPNFVLQTSMDLCKRLEVHPPDNVVESACVTP